MHVPLRSICLTVLLLAAHQPLAAARWDPGRDGVAPAHASPQHTDAQELRIPENIQVSQDGDTEGASRPVTDFSEVHLAVSPVDPEHLLGSSKFFHTPERYGFYTGVFESFDGGLSWSQEQPAGIEAYSLTSDPVNAFDHEGSGYFTLLTRSPIGLDMLKKPRGGDWQLPTVVDRTTTTDKQWIAGDMDLARRSPHAGHLYMSWTDVGSGRIVFSRSTDGNRSWSAPPLTLDRGGLQGSIVAVGPEGTVYVIYGEQIFGDAAPGRIKWVRSTDGGASFTSPGVVATTVSVPFQLPSSLFRTPASLPAFAVSPTNGNLYVSWADYRSGDADILLARSIDGGASWDEPVRLNDDPPDSEADQFQPQVSVAPDGRVAVAWLDRRLPCPDLDWIPRSHVGRENFCIDTYMSRSYDEGASWEANRRVSAQTWDPTVNLPMVDDTTGFIGDYIGLASTLDYDYPFFPSTADLGWNPRNRQQAFVARVPAVDPPYDLVPSRLELAPAVIESGQVVTVTLAITQRGAQAGRDIRAAIPLPAGLDFVEGSLSAVGGRGTAAWSPGAREAVWTGELAAGESARLRLRARVPAGQVEGSIPLRAELEDGLGRRYLRRAELLVARRPHLIFSSPPDGGIDVGPTTTVILRFDKAMDPSSLRVTSQPELPADFWDPAWAPNRESVSLRHLRPFALGRRYTLRVEAADEAGALLAPGPVPNPWTFTVEPPERYEIRLPWLARGVLREEG